MNITSFILMCCLLLLENSFGVNARKSIKISQNSNTNI